MARPKTSAEPIETDTKTPTPDPTKKFGHGITIIGVEGKGKRLFQMTPDTKEWFTKEEALANGRYWKD